MRENFYCQVSVITDINLNGAQIQTETGKLLAWGVTPEQAKREGERMARVWLPEISRENVQITISEAISA